MSLNSSKRNRNDNFDALDVELLLELIEENAKLIDDPKIELKKQGWEVINKKFNDGCIGPKRDIGALKMKLKNIKAQSKRTKLEFVDTTDNTNDNEEQMDENDNDYEDKHQGSSSNEFKFSSSFGKRKRCKKFSQSDCDLLVELFEKYCSNLDSSSTSHSVKKRSDAWDNLTQEFNLRQTNGINRDQGELKIKMKNLKATKGIKTEPNDTSTVFETASADQLESSTPKVLHNRSLSQPSKSLSPSSSSISQQRPLRIVASTSRSQLKNNDRIVDSGMLYDEFEVEYINPPPPKPMSNNFAASDERDEIEKIRKENLLIKNSVLKKKERLLELQIALAERNLRRQI